MLDSTFGSSDRRLLHLPVNKPIQCRYMTRRALLGITTSVALFVIFTTSPLAQQAPDVARPIDPGGIRLPLEADSGNQTKFSFIAYGDTRGPADGALIQGAHRDVVNRILASIPEQERAGFP